MNPQGKSASEVAGSTRSTSVPRSCQGKSYEYHQECHGERMRFNERRGQRGVWECRKCTHVITADEHDEMVRWAERGQL